MDAQRGRVITGLIRVAPRRGDHRVAIRAALALAVPLLALWAIGRVDLSMYACFGAFASLYGRLDAYADRVRMQVAAGVTLIVAMLIGTSMALLAAPAVVCVVVVATLAAIGSIVAYRWHWHPPGSLFVVFAAGATASIPATAASFGDVVVVGGASAAFSVALAAAIALVRKGPSALRRRPHRTPHRTPQGAPAASMGLAVGIGALLAGLAGLLLIGDHWYWAMVAAVAALGGAQLSARVVRGLQRLIGTLVGVVIAAGILALDLPPLATLAMAVLLRAGAELYINRNYGLAMIFVTPLALVMVELADPVDPGVLLRDRALDTAIGVAVGTAVAVVSAWWRGRAERVDRPDVAARP